MEDHDSQGVHAVGQGVDGAYPLEPLGNGVKREQGAAEEEER